MSMNPQEMKKHIKGIFHLSLTPFDSAGNLDIPALKTSIRMVTQNPVLEGRCGISCSWNYRRVLRDV